MVTTSISPHLNATIWGIPAVFNHITGSGTRADVVPCIEFAVVLVDPAWVVADVVGVEDAGESR